MRIHAARFAMAILAAASVPGLMADPLLDRVTVTHVFPMPNTSGGLDLAYGTVACPDESILLTGGASIRSDNNSVPAYVALLASNPSGNAWTAQAREIVDYTGSAFRDNLIITVVCGVTHNSASPHLQTITVNASMNRSSVNLDYAQATAACPSGTLLVSGGAHLEYNNGPVPLQAGIVTSKPSGNGWYALAREFAEAQSPTDLVVTALCADAASGISAPVVATGSGTFADDASYYDYGQATATCPAGKTRLGGGAELLSSNGTVPPSVGLMTTEPGTNSWYVVGRETKSVTRAPYPTQIFAYADCATLNGVSSVQTTTKVFTLPDQSGVLDAVTGEVYCPAGKTLIGGGAHILNSNNILPLTMALVGSSPSGNGWRAIARETTDAAHSLTVNLAVEAVCAILPP